MFIYINKYIYIHRDDDDDDDDDGYYYYYYHYYFCYYLTLAISSLKCIYRGC